MTFNVHSCRGTDGVTDPARIAEVIAACEPDIAALQEVDVGRRRSGGADQAAIIAAQLNMRSHFHPALHLQGEQYGDAILTALPSRLVRAGPLPSSGEPRGAIWTAIDIGGAELHVINTHLGLRARERLHQTRVLFGPDWLGSSELDDAPAIFLGDFNAVPASRVYRTIAHAFRDVLTEGGGRRATFPSRFPVLRLDHIFVSRGLHVVQSMVHADALARIASDHLPVSATIAVPVRNPASRPGLQPPASAAPGTRPGPDP